MPPSIVLKLISVSISSSESSSTKYFVTIAFKFPRSISSGCFNSTIGYSAIKLISSTWKPDVCKSELPPFVIDNINFLSESNDFVQAEIEPSSLSNYLHIQIRYRIPSIFISDTLSLEI